MIVVFVNSCREVRLMRKDLLRPSTGQREHDEKKRCCEDGGCQLRRCHNRLTIKGRARSADTTMAFQGLQPRTVSNEKNSLQILAPIARIFL